MARLSKVAAAASGISLALALALLSSFLSHFHFHFSSTPIPAAHRRFSVTLTSSSITINTARNMDQGQQVPIDTSRKRLFLVVLTDLDEESKAILVQSLQVAADMTIELEIWTPSAQLLGSVAKQGPHRDSQNNIYAIANIAYRKGWNHLFIADDLSSRQLNGKTRFREEKELSLIRVCAQRAHQELLVFAQRVLVQTDGGTEQPRWINGHEDLSKFVLPWWHFTSSKSVWQDGLILRDPDRRVFEASTTTSLPWEDHQKTQIQVLRACQPRLPYEVATQIIILADNGISPGPVRMPLWNRFPSNSHRVIFLLCPTTTSQVDHMESLIRGFIQNETLSVELVPQDQHRIVSRRDLITFWNEFQLWDQNVISDGLEVPLHFIREPFSDLASARFGSVVGTEGDPAIVLRTTLSRIITAPQHSKPQSDEGPNENLCHPDEPFYRNPHRWDGEFSDDEWLPLFCITNRLSEEQKVNLQTEIVIMGNPHSAVSAHVREFRPAPWKDGKAGDVDGSGTDIWAIVQEILISENLYANYAFVFGCLDAVSVMDSTVLIVNPDIYRGDKQPGKIRLPFLRGFAYARVFASDTLHYLRTLSRLQANIEDLESADGWYHRFKRPDWPAHLDDDEPESADADSD